MRKARLGVSALGAGLVGCCEIGEVGEEGGCATYHQQMRAKEKGRSARCGMISRRKPRARSSASLGIWVLAKGTLFLLELI